MAHKEPYADLTKKKKEKKKKKKETQNKKQPLKKIGRRPKQTFLQRRLSNGQ